MTAEDEGWKSQADRGNKRNRWRMSRRRFFFFVDAWLEKLKPLTGFAPTALFICWSEGFPFTHTHTHTLNYHVNSNLSFWWSSSGFYTFNAVWHSKVNIFFYSHLNNQTLWTQIYCLALLSYRDYFLLTLWFQDILVHRKCIKIGFLQYFIRYLHVTFFYFRQERLTDKPRHVQVQILDKSEVGCTSGVFIKLKY